MKPIELTLSGLQSYREEQVIDFDKLCETGLFGIFGPTGSGKSTILDAITLALYGKVERAQNGTQGIMNQAENQLTVSFTFRLNGAQGSRTFRVERRFKRTGDVNISNSVSRFIEIDDEGERVLADKLSDVTRLVEHHIGLKMDDFTRAVVLPQGKFAEFLSLKGSDRRQMLQRLFSLERYGDELMAKLARRVKEAEAEVNTCQAEQQGLGDASAEALAQAEQELQAARLRHDAARAAKEAAEARYKELAELRAWQSERAAMDAKLTALASEEASVQAREQQLRMAGEAELLQPLMLEARTAAHALEAAQTRFVGAAASREQAEARAAAEAQAAAEAAQAREQREPELLNRLERLKQAMEWQREAEQQQGDADRCEAERLQAEQALQAADLELQRMTQLLEKAALRQAELKQLLKGVERPLAERESSQAAWLASERLQEQQGLLHKLEADQLQHSQLLNAAETELRDSLHSLLTWGRSIPSWRSELSGAEQDWTKLDACVESLAEGVEASMSWTSQRHRALTKLALASELADTLHEGEPCPVCGSVVHGAGTSESEAAAHMAAKAGAEVARYGEGAHLLEAQLERWSILREELRRVRSDIHAYRDRSSRSKEELSFRLQEAENRIRSFMIEGAYEQLASGLSEDLNQMLSEVPSAEPLTADNCTMKPCADTDAVIVEMRLIAEDEHASGHGVERLCSRMEHILLQTEQCFSNVQAAWRQLMEHSDELLVQKDVLERELEQNVWTMQQAASRCYAQKKSHEEAISRFAEQQAHCRQLAADYRDHFPQWRPEEMGTLREQWLRMDREAEDYRERLERGVKYVEDTQEQFKRQDEQKRAAEMVKLQREADLKGLVRLLDDLQKRLAPLLVDGPLAGQHSRADRELEAVRAAVEKSALAAEKARAAAIEAAQAHALAQQAHASAMERHTLAVEQLQAKLQASNFQHMEEAQAARMTEEARRIMEEAIASYHERRTDLQAQVRRLDSLLQGRSVTDEAWEDVSAERARCLQDDETSFTMRVKAERDAEQLRGKHARWMELELRRQEKQLLHSRLQQLQSVFRGNTFVEYMAEEQLLQVSRAASMRLKELTKQRYALEVDSGGGFVIRDDGNGGIRRPVSTLSGGETFLTSLALALALSAQIQLRGMYPLEFFFLDEGFGTLDPELLDTVVTALEKLHSDRLAVGVISHVPELRARLPRKLVVQPAEQAGKGSSLTIEST
ncbi:AAA family ATPase [Paenibacillus marinisediminis]